MVVAQEPPTPPETMIEAFETQVKGCLRLGSMLGAGILHWSVEDYRNGGVVRQIFDGWTGEPLANNPQLRFTGYLHHCVLSGKAPQLAAFYPTAGGRLPHLPDPQVSQIAQALGPALAAHLQEHWQDARQFVQTSFPQTNEVRRLANFLPGFLRIAQRTRLPLSLLEIGCSAGLNLFPDAYRYRLSIEPPSELGAEELGQQLDYWPLTGGTDSNCDAPEISCAWHKVPAHLPQFLQQPLRVASRQGCDIRPVDIGSEEAVNRLCCWIWGDQLERLRLIRQAIDIARVGLQANRAQIFQGGAADWLEERLQDWPEGQALVLMHSVVWVYLHEDERQRIRQLMQAAAQRASATRPLYWLSMDQALLSDSFKLRLCAWDGIQDSAPVDICQPKHLDESGLPGVALAVCHPHGASLEFLESVKSVKSVDGESVD